jgi:hypothetical protein
MDIFKIVLLHVTLCIVITLAKAVFKVIAVGTSDLTTKLRTFHFSPTSIYLLLACPYILPSTLFLRVGMILISTLLLLMFFFCFTTAHIGSRSPGF